MNEYSQEFSPEEIAYQEDESNWVQPQTDRVKLRKTVSEVRTVLYAQVYVLNEALKAVNPAELGTLSALEQAIDHIRSVANHDLHDIR